MPDVSAKIKGLNVEFNDNLTTSPNIDSGDDIKTSFARIHKRFSQMKSAAYIDASISNNKTITLGDSNIGVVSIFANQGLTDIEKTNARTNIGAGTSNFSGSFNDLTDKPTTIAGYGITDAFSGSFTDLTNKPTTISGYGITDAKIQNGKITLGGNTITPITSFSSLDSPAVGGSGKYISSISETDGIISATETSMDTVPTENSANAITSGAVYTDSANQQLEIDYAINTGAKNLLNFDVCSAASTGGVSYTVNADGTITVNGTPQGTGPSYVQLMLRNDAVRVEEFCDGSHILSGCPSGGSDSSYRMYVAKGSYSRFDYGNGVLLTKTTLTDIRVVIYIAKGYTANNLVFKPMIRRAEITDDSYVPYAPTNRELYETKTEQTETNVIANLGAKNLFPITATSQTIGGVTFTVNDDGTITANGTKTNNDWLYLSTGNSLAAGTYVLSSGLASQSDTSIRLIITTKTSLGSAIMGTEGERQVHTKQLTSDYTGLYYAIRIGSGTTVNNLTFKPMIRRAEITDDTFVPYAPTNRELYEAKVTMQQAYGDATAIPVNSDLNNYTTPGIYYALVANVSSMANTPYTSTGLRLVVEKNTLSGAAVFQTLYPTSRTHLEFYRRVYEGGSWSSWYKFEGTQI